VEACRISFSKTGTATAQSRDVGLMGTFLFGFFFFHLVARNPLTKSNSFF
jgi:hypothetical protein